jgi:hypothetical protein
MRGPEAVGTLFGSRTAAWTDPELEQRQHAAGDGPRSHVAYAHRAALQVKALGLGIGVDGEPPKAGRLGDAHGRVEERPPHSAPHRVRLHVQAIQVARGRLAGGR